MTTFPVKMMTSIESLWEQLDANGQPGGALRVDDVHPCDLYAALDADGRRGLVLVTDSAVPTPPSLEAVLVTAKARQDGRFSLAFWLQAPGLLTPFAHLCQDLIDESREVDPASAGSFLLARLARWRRLLKGERGMSLAEIRGLVGELLVMSQCFNLWPPSQVVEGWMGPLDAAQDFVLPSKRIEAKAIQPDARVVRISSADQLDYAEDLVLAVVTLSTLVADDEGVTPRALVATVRERLIADGEHGAAAVFEGRLASTGYSDVESDNSIRFRVDDIKYFQNRAGFPAITRAMLPDGVAEATYDIDLSALLPFVTQLAS